MGIVDELLANPGVYVGKETAIGRDVDGGAARIVVSRLPGGAGVSLDYEILNGSTSPVLGHAEHSLIGKGDDGSTIMVIAHVHGEGISILRETDAGVFEPTSPGPYPMKVVVTSSGPGKLRHSWWYGSPGEGPVERDVAELEIVTP